MLQIPPIKIGQFFVNPVSILLWLATGGINAFFPGKYQHFGAFVTSVSATVLQFITTQQAPAPAVNKGARIYDPATGTVNGEKVATTYDLAQAAIKQTEIRADIKAGGPAQ